MSVEFLLLGGDRRQTHLAELLKERFSVGTLGVPEIEDTKTTRAQNLVLPIPSAWPDGMPRGVTWEQLEPFLQPGVTIYGGVLGLLREHLETYELRCVDLLEDETAVVENARLTAEAALVLAMQQMQESLFRMPCCVIGFGRIGQLLSARLWAFGAKITVLSGKEEKRALAKASGYEAAPSEEIKDPRIVFNTAPLQLVPTEKLEALPASTLWVELASHPGGLPEGKSFAFFRLPANGLPGKLLPVSAAEVLYRAILRHL